MRHEYLWYLEPGGSAVRRLLFSDWAAKPENLAEMAVTKLSVP